MQSIGYLLIILLVVILFPVIENAASSPGTFDQLATSSTTTLPYGATPWMRPVFPALRPSNVRPVLQRGVHFNNPGFHRDPRF